MQSASSLQDIADELDAIEQPQRPRPQISRGPKTIVVAGEFEAGKSSLINLLLREPIVPTNPTLRGRPLITLSAGDSHIVDADDQNGIPYRFRDSQEIRKLDVVKKCEIHSPNELLRGVEILEIPSDPSTGISVDDMHRMAHADKIIWATIGSQAWRLSEREILDKLGENCRAKSILAITRADKFRTADDIQKIAQRLKREAKKHFAEMVFVKASEDNIRAAKDDNAWRAAGGFQLAKSALSERSESAAKRA